MKKKINIVGLAIVLFIVSCDGTNNKIATIKNKTSSTIACALRNNEVMTDSSLYTDTTYMRYLIRSHSYDNYMDYDRDLTKAPDSMKTYIYILNLDSLNKFHKLKIVDGILKHSLIKKIIVQLNKVKEPLDTIYAE